MHDSNVFYRRLDRKLPKAVKAEGIWIYDHRGKKYLDASGGPICVNIGHGRQTMAKAIYEQAQQLAYVHGPMFTNRPVEELAARLKKYTPETIDKFYFCSSGAEAIETAVKLARQIHLANGNADRYRVVSRWLSYHGATLGSLSVGGKTAMRQPYLPMLTPSIQIPPPYCLRCYYKLSYPSCELRCAHALEDVILLEGAGSISAFLSEPICGSTVGAVVPPREYYQIIAEICRHYGVLFVLDEVMTGMGRTGKWFAADHYNIKPDIIVLGKGLTGGYLPLSAVGCRHLHTNIIKEKCGNFNHGNTFSHHPVTAAAGLETIKIIETENLVKRVEELGIYLEKLFLPLREHPHVADIRGVGLMWAIELVEDKADLKPYMRSQKIAEKLFDLLFESGIITYPCSGFTNGNGDAVMIGPPFVIRKEELEFLIQEIESAINKICP